MLSIAPDAPTGSITYRENPKFAARQAKLAAKAARLSSLATPKGAKPPLRTLPWPQFLAALENKRDIVVRAHVRWAMNRAIRHCETLRRGEGRIFELRPGGRHNIVSNGGFWRETHSGLERISSSDAWAVLKHSRYMAELEDNLHKLLCPVWAIPLAKRYVRAKLALGWELEDEEEE